MREILFRGKRCDNGEWVQGFYVRADHHWHNNGIHKDWIICGASANGGWFALHNKYAVKTDTVGQYTGLTDKNGKKIFEGDILHTEDRLVYVSWHEPSAQWDTNFIKYISDDRWTGILNSQWRRYATVIGNIHDNPELLEVE